MTAKPVEFEAWSFVGDSGGQLVLPIAVFLTKPEADFFRSKDYPERAVRVRVRVEVIES